MALSWNVAALSAGLLQMRRLLVVIYGLRNTVPKIMYDKVFMSSMDINHNPPQKKRAQTAKLVSGPGRFTFPLDPFFISL